MFPCYTRFTHRNQHSADEQNMFLGAVLFYRDCILTRVVAISQKHVYH